MAGWQDLLNTGEERVLPWAGGPWIYWRNRTWKIEGRYPREYGWFKFNTSSGRSAKLLGPAEADPGFEEGHALVKGYLSGDHLIPDDARVVADPLKLIEQTVPVFLVEPGLNLFSRAVAARLTDGSHVYLRQEFPQGPEMDVTVAYVDRKDTVDHVPGVTPPLDLAFRFASLQRHLGEEYEREIARQLEEERKKAEAEARMQEALKNIGTGAGRRVLAVQDFKTAARAALALSGAELIDSFPDANRNNMVVWYRFRNRRLECVADKTTLRIVDAGVCLTNHDTGVKGDTRFTLESLPTVIAEAMRLGRLVVWRHAPGDPGYNDRNYGRHDDDDDYDL